LTDLSDERATAVAARLNGRHPDVISIHAAPVLHDVDLAINCTPLGLREEDPLPFAVGELRADAVVADIIMKPAETRLLKAALQRGLQIHHGVHMLNSQVDLYREFFRIEIGDAKVHRT
jgi:shikimate dehydrogenase